MLKDFRTITFDSFEASRLQDNVAQALNPLTKNPLLQGHLLKDVVLTSGAITSVPHHLNRNLQGWFLVKQDTNAVVWQSNASSLSDKILELNTSATCTVNVWVF